MKFPIIELRQRNLFVLMEFPGEFVGNNLMRTRRNLCNNLTRSVIDSEGNLWVFTFLRTDHSGVRKFISRFFWNISTDHYLYAIEADISVGRFRGIVAPHQQDIDPHHREIAQSLLESVADCDAADPLRRHIHLLNP